MSKNNSILIFGNGPSARELADLGLHNIRSDVDTFGMGIAYRYFRDINWWPTYYALGDSKVVFSHREQLAKVVEDPNVTTERFFFSWPISDHPRFEQIHHCSTGDFCLRKSLELRYQNIYLIGIEGHYVEELLESRPLSNDEYFELGFDQLNLRDHLRSTLRIISKTPENNPNYFFHGYQQAGDVYSLPQSDIHRDRWNQASKLTESVGANVLNLSPGSRIVDFPKTSVASIADALFNGPTTKSIRTSASDRNDTIGEREDAETQTAPMNHAKSSFWYGPFDRESNKRLDEANVVFDLFQSAPPANPRPIIVDVGACKGGAFKEFAKHDWTVHAFEPNPPLFEKLSRKFNLPNVTLNSSAVSNVEGEEIPFYTSEESIGISSLKPFRSTHEITATVKTITLDNYLHAHEIKRIEFLKIDTEGFDLMVLKGIDLTRHFVGVILCEFEDSKTNPLGYSTDDLADYLESFGYTVYLSEWHPVIRYGTQHQWRALKRYPCELEDSNAWGNLIAFKSDPGIFAVTKALNQIMDRNDNKKPVAKKTAARKSVTQIGRRRKRSRLGNVKRALERPVEQFARVARRQVFGTKQVEGDKLRDGSGKN